uniref:Ganglioside-induced differentiation-associated protein 1 n=1 Tax=Lygus hesperus TaxID=30085 RepID=A0A0A9XY69_LYGHE
MNKQADEVLLALNEKKLTFKTKFVNIANGEQYQQWYLEVNPRGEVPAIKDGNKTIPDSMKIINHLEENYSDENHPRLVPTDQGAAVIEKHNHLHVIIHDLPADVITIGSFYHTDVVGWQKLPFIYPVRRHMKSITEKGPEKVKATAEKSSEAIKQVLLKKAEELETMVKTLRTRESFLQALERVDEVLSEVEEQLKGNKDNPEDWLVCNKFTLADVSLTTLLERLNVLGLEGRFWTGGKRPHLQNYFDRVRRREAYKKSTPSAMFHVKSLIKGITYMSL